MKQMNVKPDSVISGANVRRVIDEADLVAASEKKKATAETSKTDKTTSTAPVI